MKYVLLAKKTRENIWQEKAKGDKNHILTLLEMNLNTNNLQYYSYRIEPILGETNEAN